LIEVAGVERQPGQAALAAVALDGAAQPPDRRELLGGGADAAAEALLQRVLGDAELRRQRADADARRGRREGAQRGVDQRIAWGAAAVGEQELGGGGDAAGGRLGGADPLERLQHGAALEERVERHVLAPQLVQRRRQERGGAAGAKHGEQEAAARGGAHRARGGAQAGDDGVGQAVGAAGLEQLGVAAVAEAEHHAPVGDEGAGHALVGLDELERLDERRQRGGWRQAQAAHRGRLADAARPA
jgi:hypothetical protein